VGTRAGSDCDALERLVAQNAALSRQLQSAEQYTARTLMRATRLAQVIGVLGNDADVDSTIERTAVELAELFSSDVALLLLDSPDGLRVAGHWGIASDDLPDERVALDAIEATASVRPVGIAIAASVGLPGWLTAYGPRHLAWARLVVAEKPLGLMVLIRRADEPFEPDEESELRAISYRIALAIENGLLNRQMRSQLAQLNRLQQLTADLAGMIEPGTIGGRVAETLIAEVGVESAIVYVERDRASRLVGCAGGCEDGGELPKDPGRLGYRWQQFPMSVADRQVGLIAVTTPPRPGSEQHELLLHLVGLGALAMDKALLYDRSLEQARHDSLTGLLGHRVFHELLGEQFDAAKPFSVVLFDIDDFKQINDLHGHQAGDDVLRLVADALRKGTRTGDNVFRVGGEEFYAVLSGVEHQHAVRLAERLRRGIASAGLALRHPVTVSAGVASFPLHATDRDELLGAADAALYASKRGGKNRMSVAGESHLRAAETSERSVRLELLLQKDADTVTHSLHAANLAVQIARVLGLDDARIGTLRTAAKLHDIGKIAIPEAILNKPGPLTEEEYRIVQTHPIVGAELLSAWGLQEPARFVREHHERVDGRGYPDGLTAADTALESRIVGVADAYTAMTLDRPYRAALSRQQALAELVRHSGSQFDPDVVDALLAAEDIGPMATAA